MRHFFVYEKLKNHCRIRKENRACDGMGVSIVSQNASGGGYWKDHSYWGRYNNACLCSYKLKDACWSNGNWSSQKNKNNRDKSENAEDLHADCCFENEVAA